MLHGHEIICWFLLLLVAVSHAISGATYLPVFAYFLLSLTTALYFRMKIERMRREFILQLKSHRRELRAGGSVVVDQILLRYDTPLTSYQANIGGILCSASIPSPYLVRSGEPHAIAFVYSALSLVTGWWSLSGPLFTVDALQRNLRGGVATTVAQLIDGPLIELRRKQAEARAERQLKLKKNTPTAPDHTPTTGPNSASDRLIGQRTLIPSVPSMEDRARALWRQEQSLPQKALIALMEAQSVEKTPPAQRLYNFVRAKLHAQRVRKNPDSSEKHPTSPLAGARGGLVEKSLRGG